MSFLLVWNVSLSAGVATRRGETFRSFLIASYFLLVPRYFLFVARYFLLIARYFLLVARYFLLVARYFLLVACYFLLVARQEFLKDFFCVKVNKRFSILICTKRLICE